MTDQTLLNRYYDIFRHSSSVKSWILDARFAEAAEVSEEASVTSLRPEVGVRARLRLVQTRSRTVMNICDSLQRSVGSQEASHWSISLILSL